MRILGVDSILYLLTTYHYQTAVMKERLTLCSSKTCKWYYLFDTFFEYSSVLMAVITTVFEYVHTSEACDIEGASLLFTFSFCLPDKLNYSCVTLLKQNTLPHLKQNPASSSDIIQFQGPHKPLEKCEYSLVILQNKNVPWWTLSCKFAASVVLCSSKFRFIEM